MTAKEGKLTRSCTHFELNPDAGTRRRQEHVSDVDVVGVVGRSISGAGDDASAADFGQRTVEKYFLFTDRRLACGRRKRLQHDARCRGCSVRLGGMWP